MAIYAFYDESTGIYISMLETKRPVVAPTGKGIIKLSTWDKTLNGKKWDGNTFVSVPKIAPKQLNSMSEIDLNKPLNPMETDFVLRQMAKSLTP